MKKIYLMSIVVGLLILLPIISNTFIVEAREQTTQIKISIDKMSEVEELESEDIDQGNVTENDPISNPMTKQKLPDTSEASNKTIVVIGGALASLGMVLLYLQKQLRVKKYTNGD